MNFPGRGIQMSRTLLVVLLACALSLSATAIAAETSVDSLPPVVVKTVPVSGDKAVDPGLKAIQVTFSKDMMTKNMWSFVNIDKKAYPKTTGQPSYTDKRTIKLPVALEPGKAYALWINLGKFNAFKDTGKRAAVPYLITFETKKK